MKVNYVVHTDAIKDYIVPTLTEKQIKYVYAEEADVLNVALFGMTAKQWREANPELAKKGNIRDYTDLLHLVILNNLQNTNAELIENNVSQSKRLIRLNNSARRQMKSLQNNKNIHELEKLQNQVNNKKYLINLGRKITISLEILLNLFKKDIKSDIILYITNTCLMVFLSKIII